MELDLNANGTTCSVQVNGGVIVTVGAACANLDTSLSGGDHGQLQVSTKTGMTFGGITFTDTSQGHDFVTVPQLQNQNQTQATSTGPVPGTFSSIFTDTDVPTVATSFGVTTTINALTLGGTADYFALNSNTNGIPATNLISSKLGQAGPSGSTFTVSPNPSPGVPYSLTTQIVIHFAKKNQAITASQQIEAINVPEPASIMLMGSMLLLTGLGLRRKMTRG